MDKVSGYLWLDSEYLQPLGGLRWSAAQDAVIYPEGGVLAFAEEIALFLEGLAGVVAAQGELTWGQARGRARRVDVSKRLR